MLLPFFFCLHKGGQCGTGAPWETMAISERRLGPDAWSASCSPLTSKSSLYLMTPLQTGYPESTRCYYT